MIIGQWVILLALRLSALIKKGGNPMSAWKSLSVSVSLGISAISLSLFFGCGGPRSGTAGPPAPAELTVAVAANFRPAMEEIKKAFEARTGAKITASYGSSGNFTQQIENGAPFDVFISADRGFVDRLSRGGHTVPGTERIYARGWLVLATTPRLGRTIQLEGLKAADVKYVALANPQVAPYGRAARQALERIGLWDEVQPKVVFGENIEQAFQYVRTGQAEAGFVALSQVIGTDIPHVVVPKELYDPLDQALAILRRTPNERLARQFVDFILGPEGQQTIRKYGYEAPAPAH